MSVLDHRIERGALHFLLFEIVKSLARAPAVIAALNDQIHLLEFVLADVGGPKFARLAVETHPPNIAQAVSPNFGTHTFRLGIKRIRFWGAILCSRHERVVFGNAVRELAGSGIDI